MFSKNRGGSIGFFRGCFFGEIKASGEWFMATEREGNGVVYGLGEKREQREEGHGFTIALVTSLAPTFDKYQDEMLQI